MLRVLLVVCLSVSLPVLAGPLELLGDAKSSARQRVAAAKQLATFKDPRALDVLLVALGQADELVHDAVVEALRTRRADLELERRLGEGELDDAERLRLMKALRTLEAGSRLHRSDGGAVAVTTFVRALGHSTPAIRREAALALAVLDPVPAEAALLSHLDDVDDDVRYFVADALGGVPTPQVLAALNARFKVEKSPTVQYALKTASDRVKRVVKP